MPDHSLRKDTLIIRQGESLPAATYDYFLCRAIVQVAATEDEEYVCMRTAAGAYAWIGTTFAIGFDSSFTITSSVVSLNPATLTALTVDGYINREAEIDIEAPSYSFSTFVDDADVTEDTIVWVNPSGKGGDENEMDALILSASPQEGGFTVYGMAIPGPVMGTRTIQYRVATAT